MARTDSRDRNALEARFFRLERSERIFDTSFQIRDIDASNEAYKLGVNYMIYV